MSKQGPGGVSGVALASLLRGFAYLYLVFPVLTLVLFREPEITSAVRNRTATSVVALCITIFVFCLRGRQGLFSCLVIWFGIMKHRVDTRLWQPPNNMSLSGKIAVVTGGNSGLGLTTAKALSRLGAHVVITCRSVSKCERAVEEVNAAGRLSGGSARPAMLHLGSLQSALELGKILREEYSSIHFLFCNAGSTPQYNLTKEGFEDAFGGMHLAHMAVALGLLPSLRNAGETTGSPPSRIVMVSSEVGVVSASGFFKFPAFQPSFMDGNGEGDLRGELTRGDGTMLKSLPAYGRAKLSNVLFAFEINRQLRSQRIPVIAHALHTGAVYTKSASDGLTSLFSFVPGLPYIVSTIYMPLIWRSLEEGSRTLLYAALSSDPPMLEGGQYVNGICRPSLTEDSERMIRLRRANDRWGSRLWSVSLRLLHVEGGFDLSDVAPYLLADQ